MSKIKKLLIILPKFKIPLKKAKLYTQLTIKETNT
jgi:hypothetical protein